MVTCNPWQDYLPLVGVYYNPWKNVITFSLMFLNGSEKFSLLCIQAGTFCGQYVTKIRIWKIRTQYFSACPPRAKTATLYRAWWWSRQPYGNSLAWATKPPAFGNIITIFIYWVDESAFQNVVQIVNVRNVLRYWHQRCCFSRIESFHNNNFFPIPYRNLPSG